MKREYDLDKLKIKRRGALPKDTKVQKTIRLDLEVLSWLMQEGERRAIPYQTLINATLKEAMNKKESPSVAVSADEVRKIAREEARKVFKIAQAS